MPPRPVAGNPAYVAPRPRGRHAAILAELNPPQLEAVETLEGPLLILAGAGSGKTRVVTRRIANLIAHGVPPWTILAVTFTNKAAGEMRRRVEELVGTGGVWLSTFHSFCARLLRREAAALDLSPDYTIYDEGDARDVLKRILKPLDLDKKKFSPAVLKRAVSDFKNRGLTPDDVPQNSWRARIIHQVYTAYAETLRRNHALDFDDLLLHALRLFQTRGEVLERWQRRFRYLLVDEYQDTNACQYELIKLLGRAHGNVCVTGDPDQSIYAWRGADVRNILSFERDFPNAKVVRLEQNYRSTANILAAADAVIAHNTERKKKKLWTEKEAGQKGEVLAAEDDEMEAYAVAARIGELVAQKGRSFGELAVFYRTNAQSRALETAFIQATLPYQLVGGTAFYERREVKDVLAYLRLAVNPRDDAAFLRTVNVPKRGVGQTTVEKLAARAAELGLPLAETVGRPEVLAAFRPQTRRGLTEFAAVLKKLRQAEKRPVAPVVRIALEKSGLLKSLEDTAEEDRLANLEELVNAAAAYDAEHAGEARQAGADKDDKDGSKSRKNNKAADIENENPAAGAEQEAERAGTLAGFLEEIALVADVDRYEEDHDRVTLMTLHSAKGLEFPVVFIVGLEEGLFPLGRRPAVPDEGEDLDKALAREETSAKRQEEEERRLFYVGVTRAREELYLTHARFRRRYGYGETAVPSRFLDEIPPELLTGDVRRGRAGDDIFTVEDEDDDTKGNAAFTAFERQVRTAQTGGRRKRYAGNFHGRNYHSRSGRPLVHSKPSSRRARGKTRPEATGKPAEKEPFPDGELSQLDGPGYEVGDAVEHSKFGRGVVVSFSGSGQNVKVRVRFKRAGPRLLLVRLAGLKRVR